MPQDSADPAPDLPSLPFRVATLGNRKRTHVSFVPDTAGRRAVAALLGLLELPEFRLEGDIVPEGRHDLRLEARLHAVVVQPCGITLAPVKTRLSEPVLRRYLRDFDQSDAPEIEIPEDDSAEAMPDSIDVAAVAIEALALALPLYPRAPGVALTETSFAEPGTAPLRDGDLKPFAGLAGLAQKLARPGNDPADS